jgi:hypothetical protein
MSLFHRRREPCLNCGDELPKYATPFCSHECADAFNAQRKSFPIWPIEVRVGMGPPCTYMKQRRADKR